MARSSYQTGRLEQRTRKDGLVYVLRYRLREGVGWSEKTKQLVNERGQPCKNAKEARRAADKVMLEINAVNNRLDLITHVLPQSMTMSEFARGLWQHHKSKLKPSTTYHYESVMKLYILPAFGSKALSDVAPKEVTLFLASLESKGLSGAYRQVIYQLLNTIFETAVAHDLVERSPVRRKLHRPALDRKEKPTLTAGEIRQVVDAVNEEYRPVLLCIALTGLRIGEMLGLYWKDIDFGNGTLTVSRSLWRKRLMSPKTKGSKRTLHMPSALSETLQMHRATSRWNGADDFVFAKADGASFGADWLRKKVLHPALETIGIKRGKNTHGFHLFRHSAASIVHSQTRDMSLAQRLLGHSRLSTTADIYAHTESIAKEATETLAREIWGSCGLTVAEGSAQVN